MLQDSVDGSNSSATAAPITDTTRTLPSGSNKALVEPAMAMGLWVGLQTSVTGSYNSAVLR